jgi:hypothetical protein
VTLKKGWWVNRIECSPTAEGTAYVALSRHRHDDRAPYLFRTTDFGATWRSVANGLPDEAPVHVVRTSPRNPDLLFAGTERGLYVSRDGAATWSRLRGGLPSVPVYDLVLHPREHELVIATHGRGVYVMDVAALEDLTPAVAAAPAHLFGARPVTLRASRPSPGLVGGKLFAAPNPPTGAVVWYHLKEPAAGKLTLQVTDKAGKVVGEISAPAEAGLHRVVWNLRPPSRRGAATSPPIAPGEYVVRLKVGDTTLTRPLRVEAAFPGATTTADDGTGDP